MTDILKYTENFLRSVQNERGFPTLNQFRVRRRRWL